MTGLCSALTLATPEVGDSPLDSFWNNLRHNLSIDGICRYRSFDINGTPILIGRYLQQKMLHAPIPQHCWAPGTNPSSHMFEKSCLLKLSAGRVTVNVNCSSAACRTCKSDRKDGTQSDTGNGEFHYGGLLLVHEGSPGANVLPKYTVQSISEISTWNKSA